MKVAVLFGTRPEAVKLAPVIKALRKDGFETVVITTAQHRDLLDPFIELFSIETDYDLDLFKAGQTLCDITSGALYGLCDIFNKEKPDVCLVQGDTTTVFAGALAAFYTGVKVGHIEAGLRSHNIYSPYPEEANRKMTGVISEYHFAPTEEAADNLLKENYSEDKIFVVGNTVIDALKEASSLDYAFEAPLSGVDFNRERVILLTAHRRENQGEPMERIFKAVRDILDKYEDTRLVFPMHLTPKVREAAKKYFKDQPRAILTEPLGYLSMVNLMKHMYFAITDSGGIQEEAPFFGKPVLVIREETERPEGIFAGTAKLVGTSYEGVFSSMDELLKEPDGAYKKMSAAISPYGDGKASERICKILKNSEELRI